MTCFVTSTLMCLRLSNSTFLFFIKIMLSEFVFGIVVTYFYSMYIASSLPDKRTRTHTQSFNKPKLFYNVSNYTKKSISLFKIKT